MLNVRTSNFYANLSNSELCNAKDLNFYLSYYLRRKKIFAVGSGMYDVLTVYVIGR
jgi:hypothetical protein